MHNRHQNVLSCDTLQSLLDQLWNLYNLLQVDTRIDFDEKEDFSIAACEHGYNRLGIALSMFSSKYLLVSHCACSDGADYV